MNRLTSLTTAAVLLAGGLLAVPTAAFADKPSAKTPGVLRVYDDGAMFTGDGIDRAKATMGNTTFDHGLTLVIDTYAAVPKGKTPPTKAEEARFFEQWAREAATGDKAKGVFVLVCRSPGYVQVLADKPTRDRGFTAENEQRLRELFLNAFKDAAAAKKEGKSDNEQFEVRDKALSSAVEYVISDLKGTTVVTGNTAKTAATTTPQPTKKAGMGIAGWICLGLCVLLCIWVTVALIRALTAPAYYGGPGYYGGGGFGTAFFGGMFGVMAGMYLYDSIAGTHYYDTASAADYNGGGYDSGNDTPAGEGDFSGDAGAGGSYDDGGGDYGGDTGGGGDYGGSDDYGGGGDFGGGGGDFGGDF